MRAGKCLTSAFNGIAYAIQGISELETSVSSPHGDCWHTTHTTETSTASSESRAGSSTKNLLPGRGISGARKVSLWVCYQGSLLSRLVTAVLWETLICAPLTVPLHQKQGTAKEQSLLVFGKKGSSENWESVGMKMSDWGSEWGRDSKHRGAISGERSLNYRQIGKWWRRKEREKWGWGSPLHQRPNKLRFNAAVTSWGTEQDGWKAHKLSSWMSTALMLAPPPATCMMCKGQFFNLFVPPSPHL